MSSAETRAHARISRIASHLNSANTYSDAVATGVPVASTEEVKWNGWGYNDTEFVLNHAGKVTLTGSRYLFSGRTLPNLRSWMEEKVGLDVGDESSSQPRMTVIPAALSNVGFMKDIEGHYARTSIEDSERLFHGHGHTNEEIFNLRYGSFRRLPDVVVWPGSHEHVEAIVSAAVKHNVIIIPFGGGTSVSQALLCPENESRFIVSLDMKAMNKVKWVDHKSLLACIEAGAVGKDLEVSLNRYGYTLGHEPDSSEFSSMGGWIATRASGMKKNAYGNIEDIVVNIRIVTPTGTIMRGCDAPRVSVGPDIQNVIMGSEGTLGVVTEVHVRLRPKPKVRKFGSVIFPDFESGVSCLHEVAIKRLQPASIRLVDNMQFQFGQALKPESTSWKDDVKDKVKKWYVTQHKGFDPDKMVAATLVFEGTASQVRDQERNVYQIAVKYGGMKAGEENGVRGYFLTYMIAYLRDFGFNYCFMAESFETSIAWSKVPVLCLKVKAKITEAAKKRGVQGTPFVSCRVTQVYDIGACVYFYFGFLWKGLKNPVQTFAEVEHEARAEILRLGGSLSHHHGIGKLRKDFVEQSVSAPGVNLLKGIKKTVDPQNIMGSGNLITLQ